MSKRLVIGVLLGGLVVTAFGQSSTGPLSIEERQTGRDRGDGAGQQAPGTIGDEGLYLLMQEIRRLEEQVQALHGRIEELEHERERDRRAERERYLDLDSRINALAEAVVSPKQQPASGGDNDRADSDPQSDRAAYMAGREKLLERDMDGARDSFSRYLDDFPEGRFRPFAHFWLGEIHRSSSPPDPEIAAQHFSTVVDDYPGHSQVPSALYKLAQLRVEAGRRDEAKKMLQRIRSEFSDSSEARMAASMLEQLEH